MRTDIVVVLFNTDSALVESCVRSIELARRHAGIHGSTILFDNASNKVFVAPDEWDVVVRRSETNLGFGAAMNKVVEGLSAETTLLLNPDAELSTTALAEFQAAHKTFPSALLSGWLENGSSVQVDAMLNWIFSFDRLARRRTYAKYLVAHEQMDVVDVQKVCGGALFANTTLLKSYGPFDERFFLYGEDADLSRRASRDSVRLLAVPGARVLHAAASSQANHGELVERARADAAIRLGAYHLPILLSYIQRLELGVITLLGVLAPRTSSSTRGVRLSRFKELGAWLGRTDRPKFSPSSISNKA